MTRLRRLTVVVYAEELIPGDVIVGTTTARNEHDLINENMLFKTKPTLVFSRRGTMCGLLRMDSTIIDWPVSDLPRMLWVLRNGQG